MDLEEIGAEIRLLRKTKGLKALVLAKQAGVDRTWLSKLETGRTAEAGYNKINRVLRVLDKQLAIKNTLPLPTLNDMNRERQEHG